MSISRNVEANKFSIKELPAVIQSDPQPIISSTNTLAGNDMKIAFRYKNLPTSQKVDTTYIGHHYDLAKNMSFKDIENSDILYWDGQRMETVVGMFTNQNYNELLKTIKSKIKDGKFFLKDNSTNSTILRLGVYSLGSPMWLPPRNSFHPMNNSRDLDMFIFCLRALVRSAFAVAVITIPTHLYHKNSLDRCIHSSDIAMRLQAFSGTELENNVNLSEYHGFFHLTKVAAINSFTSKHPGAVEYVFKLRRKKLYIEKLHLPPDIQDTGDKHTGISTECGNSDKRLLEF